MSEENYAARYKDLATGNVFSTLRILLVGRPGSGKSTLVDLVLGLPLGQGPESSTGSVGTNEWSHPDLPLKLHVVKSDSAGDHKSAVAVNFFQKLKKKRDYDKYQAEQVALVRQFLETRQSQSDFSNHVHLVWVVLSAVDERNVDIVKILEEIGRYDLPILLIVTHTDRDPQGVGYAENVERHLGVLLEHVKSKERVLRSIVRVSNDIHSDPVRVDHEALTRVSAQTLDHLQSEDLKLAWAAAQGVDLQNKLQLSAREIVGYKDAAIYTSVTGLVPGTHQTIVGSLLVGMCNAVCNIWAVPKAFKKSIRRNLASEEVFQKQLNLLLKKLKSMAAMGIGGAVGGAVGHKHGTVTALGIKAVTPLATRLLATSVVAAISDSLALTITPVAVAAVTVGWVAASRNDAYHSMLAMVSLGVMTTGAILYVKAAYDPRGWNENRKRSEYDVLIKEFVSLHGADLKQSVERLHSVSDVFNPAKDRQQLIALLTNYFDSIFKEHSTHHEHSSSQV